jgi:hypothetical protein
LVGNSEDNRRPFEKSVGTVRFIRALSVGLPAALRVGRGIGPDSSRASSRRSSFGPAWCPLPLPGGLPTSARARSSGPKRRRSVPRGGCQDSDESTAMSCVRRTGLVSRSSNPAVFAQPGLACRSSPLSAISRKAPAQRARSLRATSQPSIPGMRMSTRTAVGGPLLTDGDRARAVVGHPNLGTLQLDGLRDAVGDQSVVVNHQHPVAGQAVRRHMGDHFLVLFPETVIGPHQNAFSFLAESIVPGARLQIGNRSHGTRLWETSPSRGQMGRVCRGGWLGGMEPSQ